MKQDRTIPQWVIAALFPLVLFYYEVVFRLFTVKGLVTLGTAFMALFCIVLGGIAFLLVATFQRRWLRWLLTELFFLLSAVPFLIEYFVYKQFKIFYDLSTMFGGASDALSDYRHDIYVMITSPSGMSCIVLLLLPAAVFLLVGWWFLTPRVQRPLWRAFTAVALVGVLVLGCFGISQSGSLSLLCGAEYNYQTAVSNLGLLTGISLDIRHSLSGGGDEGFEAVPTMPRLEVPTEPVQPTVPSDPTAPQETLPPETEPPVVYTPNQMELNLSDPNASGTIAELNAYVASQTASLKNEFTGLFAGKNLVFITAEAFTAEVLDPELTPTLYRLAYKGIQFTDYYQPASAGTTGGEYQNIFGMLPTRAGLSFKRTKDNLNYFTMGSQLNRLGYYGKAFHNNSYTYYDRDKTHTNLGYSDGFMGYGNGMEAYVSKQWPQSDLEMIAGTLPTYIDRQPFNVYYMSVSGHSGYSKSANSMTNKNWERVKHLDCSDRIKGYFAANLELEDAVAHLVAQLEEKGIADDTVIVIATDHFPYGLDDDAYIGNMPYLSELYGFNVNNHFQRDHSRLIIWSGCLEDMEPIVVDTPTSSLDILPTLSNLFGTEFDSRLMVGRDVFSDAPALVFNMSYHWKTEYGTYNGRKFTPVNDTIVIPEGYVETVKAIVRNKLRYCEGVLDEDYFRYLFENAS